MSDQIQKKTQGKQHAKSNGAKQIYEEQYKFCI